jgi:hypothetical protein
VDRDPSASRLLERESSFFSYSLFHDDEAVKPANRHRLKRGSRFTRSKPRNCEATCSTNGSWRRNSERFLQQSGASVVNPPLLSLSPPRPSFPRWQAPTDSYTPLLPLLASVQSKFLCSERRSRVFGRVGFPNRPLSAQPSRRVGNATLPNVSGKNLA